MGAVSLITDYILIIMKLVISLGVAVLAYLGMKHMVSDDLNHQYFQLSTLIKVALPLKSIASQNTAYRLRTSYSPLWVQLSWWPSLHILWQEFLLTYTA